MTGPGTNPQLFCHIRAGVTLSYKLGEDSVIGRDEANVVAVPIEGVSRMHARIRFDGGSYWLEDLKSTNGTFLNGQAVTQDRLRHLDVITLGKEVDLVFVVRTAAEVRTYRAIVRAALVREGGDAAPYEIAPGEITLGRATTNNLIADAAAVSKLHARIERTRTQLVLQDLGSANGTFVNGVKVAEVFLKGGDTVSLAGVETYKVVVELGEVTSASGSDSAVGGAGAGEAGRSRFSADWRTRFDWSVEERGALAELRRQLEERDREDHARRIESDNSKPQTGRPTPSAKPPAPSAGGAPGIAPSAVPPPAPKPGGPARPATPPASASPGVTSSPLGSPAAVRPPAAAAKPIGPIVAVHLTGAGYDLVLREPGEYDLGRSPEVELCIDHPTVSRMHARLILSDDRAGVFLQDEGGAKGTRHNGREVTKRERLSDQDTIGVGEVNLKVSIERA